MNDYLAKMVQRFREISNKAGVNFKCLEADWSPDDDPVADVEGEAGETAIIRLNGVISEWWGVDVTSIMKELDELKPSAIEVYINSPGGSYFDGLALFNDLRRRAQDDGVTVSSEVNGIAASAATLPFLAGSKRTMGTGSTLMIHRATVMTYLAGDADFIKGEAEKIVKGLNSADKGLVAVYTARTGNSTADMEKAIAAETWMMGDEAVDEGFATEARSEEESEGDDNEEMNSAKMVVRGLHMHAMTGVMSKVS